MAVLVYAKHDNSALNDATAKAMTAAKAMGGDITVLVAGENCAGVAEAAAKLEGAAKVLHVEGAQYAHRLAEPLTDLFQSLAGDYEHIVFPATTTGKNVAPRVAALLDVMQISDILSVEGPKTFTRPIYAGNAIATVESGDAGTSSFVGSEIAKSDRPELTAAKIIVSGGRALGSAEKFNEVMTPLADKLGAALGASRAAVDAGYAPNDWQVGQTGKIVAPQLYVACGISGAIQHLAGMKDSKVIVAINKDPEAPIFSVADYGLEADLFTAVPELAAALDR